MSEFVVCGAVNPHTKATCVFGQGHAVGYHHGDDAVNWPVSSAFPPAPVAPEVVELASLVGDPFGPADSLCAKAEVALREAHKLCGEISQAKLYVIGEYNKARRGEPAERLGEYTAKLLAICGRSGK
jgi:hypothetical protein